MPIQSTAGSLSIDGFKSNTLQIGTALYKQIQTIVHGRQGNLSFSKDGLFLGIGLAVSSSSNGGSGLIYKWNGTAFSLIKTFFSSTIAGYGNCFAFNSDATIMAMQTQASNKSPAVSAKVGFFTRTAGTNTFSLQQEVTLPSTSSTNPTPITSMQLSDNGDYIIINCKRSSPFGGFENGYIYGLTGTNTWSLQVQRTGVETGVAITSAGDIAVFGSDDIYTRSGSTWSVFGPTPTSGIIGESNPIEISGNGEYILSGNDVYYPVSNWSSSSVLPGWSGGSRRIMSKDSEYILEPTVFKEMNKRSGNNWNFYANINPIPNQVLGFGSEYIQSAAIDGTGKYIALNNNLTNSVGQFTNYIFEKV